MALCALAPLRETFFAAVTFGIVLSAGSVYAADFTTDTVLKNLQRPSGLAVRPAGTADRYELFIAESGADRVARWSNLKPDDTQTAIEGFPIAGTDNPTTYDGPMALVFLDPGLLVVGDKARNLMRVYELPEQEEALQADKSRENLTSAPDEIACSALTRTRVNEFVPDQLISIIRDEKGQGRLRKSRIQAGTVGAIQPFAEENEFTPADSFEAITTSPTGRVVAIQHDADHTACRLTFFNPIDGTMELSVQLDLPWVVALAYSPTTGNLYAADLKRGLYRIDDASQPGKPACRATKIADIARPIALAFAPDGALYVTTFGTTISDGTLLVLTGEL